MVRHFRCVHSERIDDSGRRMESYCHEYEIHPVSIESEYCIVSGNMAGDSSATPDFSLWGLRNLR